MSAIRRGGSALVASAAAGGVGLTVAALIVAAPLPPGWRLDPPLVPDHAAGLMFPLVGAYLVARRPRLVIGWLMLVGGLLCAVNVFSSAQVSAHASAGDMDTAGWFRIIGTMAWALGGSTLAVLLPLYSPDGRLPSRRWRPVLVFTVAVTLIEAARAAVRPTPSAMGYPFPRIIPNPIALEALAPYNHAVQTFTKAGTTAAVVCALLALGLRFARGDATIRRQIAWPLATFAGYVAFLIAGEGFWLAGSLWTGLVPVAMAFSVLRYRLYGIETVVSRAVVATGLVVVVSAVYFGVAALAGMFVTGYDAVAGPVAALVTGALFRPVLTRLRRLMDLLLYGRHGDPRELARRLVSEIGASDPRGALAAVTTSVREALGVTGVTVDLGGAGTAEAGETGPAPRQVPLVWHGEPVGRMLLGPPGPRRFAAAYNERLIAAVTPYVADVAHAVIMAADLERSRERILTAREEERRRLRRDLHDGLGQALAGMSMSITLARASLRGSPESADRLLGELRTGMDTVSQEIRELVYGLRPPSLDDLGLTGAVRALAAETGLAATVTAEDLPTGLPAAVEVAAYRIVQEALTNVRKHAGTSTAAVTLRHCERRGALVVTVGDDGGGLRAGLRPGVGFSSMRERAAELGGTCSITSPPGGGTLVSAVLPLPGGETAMEGPHRRGDRR
ncbi:sensor histidine kinase [Spongiactinospora rosea]|uniref:histidine kinase n=1 Tax=Spongiactinospora rosea TaxID=2248750 RepID=A0A366M3L8_9ACTN|nr:sensor histidine kinase [Spongiactinospora rosea]RBQ20184.1 sensor histidine kinase [Spongiactinospora rosea]